MVSGQVRVRWGQARGVAAAALMVAHRRVRVHGAVVLAYHDIGTDGDNHTDYYVSPTLLRKHLQAARSWGYRFVELATLVDLLGRGEPVDGLAAVAFDDSLVGVHHHAMPVLLDLAVPSTVFTVSNSLGSDPSWWSGAARVMTESELAEVARAGMTVAAHTRSHPSLPALSDPRLHDEVSGSRRQLEDLIGSRVDLFAYPYGHYDPRVCDAVSSAGYHAAFSFLNGRITPDTDIYRLPRINMSADQNRARLAYHLARPHWSWPDHQLRSVGGN